MKQALLAHCVLFLLAALAAGWVWERGGRSADVRQIRVLRLALDDISQITHDWPGGLNRLNLSLPPARLHMRHDNEGEEPRERSVPPGHIVLRGLDLLTPLWASRRIEAPSDEQRAVLGLSAADRVMRIGTRQGQTFQLRFGKETYGGDGRYLQLDDDPDVYLVDARVARSFEGPARRLTESRLLPLEETEIQAVTVQLAGQAARRFEAKAAKPAPLYFENGHDAHAAPGLTQLVKHLKTLFATDYQEADRSDIPALLSIHIEDHSGSHWQLELLAAGDDGQHPLIIGPWQLLLNPVAAGQLLESVHAFLPVLKAPAR